MAPIFDRGQKNHRKWFLFTFVLSGGLPLLLWGSRQGGAILRGWTPERGADNILCGGPVSKPFMVNLDFLVILHGSIQEDMILEFPAKNA